MLQHQQEYKEESKNLMVLFGIIKKHHHHDNLHQDNPLLMAFLALVVIKELNDLVESLLKLNHPKM